MAISISDYPSSIRSKFRNLFNQEPLIIRSPGRINLIGEHTDYNMGFVMPAAINKAIYLGIQRRDDNEIHLHSLDYEDDHTTTTNRIVRSGKLWPDYILGVVEQMYKMGRMQEGKGNRIHRMGRIHKMQGGEGNRINRMQDGEGNRMDRMHKMQGGEGNRMNRMQDGEGNGTKAMHTAEGGGIASIMDQGFNIVFGGDIPPGAGLSSSAALECATAYALNELFDLGLEKMAMVKISQAAENEFVGMKCGIMDQFASMFGKKDFLMRLDCQSLDHSYIPFHLQGVTVVLFDTRVKHSLASSAYNERREQCEEGVRLVAEGLRSKVGSLRDVTEEMLVKYVKPVNELVYNRCSFVVAENERLLAGCKDLENNDIIAFGKKMFETHEGLSKLYEVSCKELDILVDVVKASPDVLGARMMGGGFGGCTINLIRNDAVAGLIRKVSEKYKEETGVEMLVYEVKIEDGTGIVKAQ